MHHQKKGELRTEVEGHAEVRKAGCGQDDYGNLVKEPDASRPLRVAGEIVASQIFVVLLLGSPKLCEKIRTMRSRAMMASSEDIMKKNPTQNQLYPCMVR